MAAIFLHCTTTEILWMRWWWDKGSEVESFRWRPISHRKNWVLVAKTPRDSTVMGTKWWPASKCVFLVSTAELCLPPLSLPLWQGLYVKVQVLLSRWHLEPAYSHLSKEQWRLHQVACHLTDLCHIRALLMVSLRTAWWGCSPCWRGSEVHVAAPMECTKCITKVQPHCNLDDIILHVKVHRWHRQCTKTCSRLLSYHCQQMCLGARV